MPLTLTNDFVNGEIADAVPVQNNYDLIEGYINSEVITADGLTQMQAPLLLQAGDPTQPNHAANKDYVDAQMPVGTILMWAAATAPSGPKWHLCDGASLSVSAYTELHDRIGVRYGGSGSSFLLPNLKGRFPVGNDPAQTAFNLVGESGGSFTVPVPPHGHPMPHSHPMTHDHGNFTSSGPTTQHRHVVNSRFNSTAGNTAYMMAASTVGTIGDPDRVTDADSPTHVHNVNVPTWVGNTGGNSTPDTGDNTVATGPAGGSIATTMIQPYVVIQFIIRII